MDYCRSPSARELLANRSPPVTQHRAPCHKLDKSWHRQSVCLVIFASSSFLPKLPARSFPSHVRIIIERKRTLCVPCRTRESDKTFSIVAELLTQHRRGSCIEVFVLLGVSARSSGSRIQIPLLNANCSLLPGNILLIPNRFQIRDCHSSSHGEMRISAFRP